MHIDDWNDDFLSKFDPEVYFRALQTAEVNAPMIYIQSHVGLCYWPTKIGRMHKAFRGREQMMRHLFDLCHSADMDVIAYYSNIFNNWAYDEHPEWRMLDINGKGSRSTGRYGQCCPNNMAYRQFVSTQISEFCDYFEFEGVFFDMSFWPMVCYCKECKARWANEIGGEIPAVIDWRDIRWQQFSKKRYEWMGEFAQFSTNEVKKHKPDCSVEHQYALSLDSWLYGVNENLSIASDYIGTDRYGGLSEQSFACKAWYNLTQNQPFQYMTSRCYPNLVEHTTNKSMDQLRLTIMMTLMHNGATLIIDAIDPTGTFDERVYQKLGEIFGETKLYEKYFKRGEMSYDVGVYFKLDGKMDIENNEVPVDSTEAGNSSMPSYEALNGAAVSLRKHHIPFSVVNNWKLELIDKLSILVLPDVPDMEMREIEAVAEFVRKGGKLYMSGHSAPSLLQEIFDVQWNGLTEENITYLAPTEASEVVFDEFTKQYPLVMFEKAVKISGKPKGEILATLTLPYTTPSSSKFSSIHSNPPGIDTGLPAMIKMNYGEGMVIWSALPIEKADRIQHSDIFAGIIQMLAGNDGFQFGAEAIGSVECIMFDSPEHNQKTMRIINLQEDFHTIPAINIDVWIRSDKMPQKVFRVSDEMSVDFHFDNGRVSIHIDILKQYETFVFQF
jgi:hypothetical protein